MYIRESSKHFLKIGIENFPAYSCSNYTKKKYYITVLKVIKNLI